MIPHESWSGVKVHDATLVGVRAWTRTAVAKRDRVPYGLTGCPSSRVGSAGAGGSAAGERAGPARPAAKAPPPTVRRLTKLRRLVRRPTPESSAPFVMGQPSRAAGRAAPRPATRS